MPDITIKHLADRFEEAARTADRLPPVRVQGYFNTWPLVVRQRWERYVGERRHKHYPPAPEAIDRMLETMQWVTLLDEPQRHLIWQRAQHTPWKEICAQLGCDRSTAWRRWQHALTIVTVRLNEQRGAGPNASINHPETDSADCID